MYSRPGQAPSCMTMPRMENHRFDFGVRLRSMDNGPDPFKRYKLWTLTRTAPKCEPWTMDIDSNFDPGRDGLAKLTFRKSP